MTITGFKLLYTILFWTIVAFAFNYFCLSRHFSDKIKQKLYAIA